jgi:hypothetical protein
MRTILHRLFYGLLFAIPLMMVTFIIVQASAPGQDTAPNSAPVEVSANDLDCQSCHRPFYDAWEQSAHGNATSDPAFRQAWEAQGEPVDCLVCHVTGLNASTGEWEEDGISCKACHSPITANHPKEPMSTDSSAAMCGKCHPDTYFEWQVSAHSNEGLDCYGCHDPHMTSLKAESPALLCASCHRDRSSNYTHSAHSEQGLTCANCHLVELDSTVEEGRSAKDHSFFVSLDSCNSCHVYEMHDPIEVHQEDPTPREPDAMAAVEHAAVFAEPDPVSPLGFSTLAGLIGIALGIVVAPWIDKAQLGLRNKRDEE